jgi:hypothetical protein
MLFQNTDIDVGLKRKFNEEGSYYDQLLLSNDILSKQWVPKLPSDGNQLFQIIARTLDENTLLLTALTILKNLTFEASNETLIGASTCLMKHFTSLIVASFGVNTGLNSGNNSSIYEASQLSLDIVHNISSRLDLTGVKRMAQSLWYGYIYVFTSL